VNDSGCAKTSAEQMTPCKVSIIMPVYNGERYLRAAIESVLDQTYESWELIVVDDGSTDNTARLVSEISENENRISYLYQQNGGQANARNTGIKNARGDLIAFLDQDDLWMKEKLELQVKAIEDSGADVIFSNGFLFVDDDVHSETEEFPTVHGKFRGSEMFRLLFIQNRIPVLSALVKGNALTSIGLLDENPSIKNSDDYDLWLRLASNDALFLGLPDPLVRYRLHSAQASKDMVKTIAAVISVLKKHEQSELLSKQEKYQRLWEMYDLLLLSLVDQNRFDEARDYLKELRAREGFMPAALARTVLLKIAPGYYRRTFDFIYRVRGGVSRRIVRYGFSREPTR
jgi:glycosyltransferase involved in cell wall biosynthesis